MKKLLNKRGSVLFLVVVVMSILIIAASATYYIVSNQHSSVEVRYGSEQSYQTALSVSDAVSDYIDGYVNAILSSGSDLTSVGDNIVTKMLELADGEALTADDIDFTDYGMGGADVTIQRYGANEDDGSGNTVQKFAITTKAEVNGESTSVTKILALTTGPTEYFTRFLTCTGNRGEDVTFGAYSILSDAYFENEFTIFGSSDAARMSDNFYSSGSVIDKGIQFINSEYEDLEMVVADTLILANNTIVFMPNGGTAYIGGDLKAEQRPIAADAVYVLGDLTMTTYGTISGGKIYVNGDCSFESVNNNGEVYVNGDLYLSGYSTVTGKYYVTGNVYLSGAGTGYYCQVNSNSNTVIEYGGNFEASNGNWTIGDNVKQVDAGKRFDEDKVTEVANYIASSTAKQKYQEWKAEEYFDDVLNADDSLPVIQPGSDGNYTCTIKENSILLPCEYWSGDWSHNHYIVFDTSEETGSGSDIYIKLQPLDGKDTFSFVQFQTESDYTVVNVLIKGSHSVIFVLPDGVNFKSNADLFVGHLELVLALSPYNTMEELISNVFDIRSTYFANLSNDRIAAFRSYFCKEPATEAIIIDKSVGSPFAGSANIHNNIFLVTTGSSNVFDFSGTCTFCGYIYAPDAIMDSGTTGSSPGISFIGGLIIGSYTYNDMSAVLIFTQPFDYSDNYGLSERTDIVKYLMSFANSGGGTSSVSEDTATLQGYEILGYK